MLAEWLDNDEDGCVDTPEVLLAAILIFIRSLLILNTLGFGRVPVSPGYWVRPRAGAGERRVPGHQVGYRQGRDH